MDSGIWGGRCYGQMLPVQQLERPGINRARQVGGQIIVLEFARETCPVVKPSRMRSSARCGNNVGYTDGNCLRE